MEKGNIKIVEIADFKNSEHVLDYVDNDFVIINSLEGSPYNEDTIRLGCFLIAICLEGCIQLDVNYKTYQLEAGNLLLGLPPRQTLWDCCVCITVFHVSFSILTTRCRNCVENAASLILCFGLTIAWLIMVLGRPSSKLPASSW